MEKLKGQFIAKDNDGKEYTIYIYAQIIDVSSHDNQNARIEGKKSLVTDDGLTVNRIRKGEYLVVATDLLLWSDALDAP